MTRNAPTCKICKFCFDPILTPPRAGGARCHHSSRLEFDPVYGLIIHGLTCRRAREVNEDVCGPSGKLHEMMFLSRMWRFLFGASHD